MKMIQIPVDARQIQEGPDGIYGVTGDGELRCWSETMSNFCNGNVILQNVQSYSVTMIDGCAVLQDGKIYCWPGRFEPRGVHPIPILNVKQAGSDGTYTGCAATEESIFCWGWDNKPWRLPESKKISSLVVSIGQTCGLSESDQLLCWKTHKGATMQTQVPVVVSQQPIRKIKSSSAHICAIDNSGDILCWGDGRRGQLGDGTFMERTMDNPARISACNIDNKE